MKEDYLWDKTGSDPAIERLENTLRVFSFDESSRQTPAPAIEVVEKPSFFRLLSVGFAAAAACIAIAMISWTLSNQFEGVEDAAVVDHGQATTSVADVAVPVEPALTKPDSAVMEVSSGAKRHKAIRKRAIRPVAITAKANRRKPDVEKLSKEEIYAYNRLVLALSITGDKLNLVREKIKGE